jgi:ribosomal protein L37E
MYSDILLHATPHAHEAASSDPTWAGGVLVGGLVATGALYFLFNRRASMDCPDCGSSFHENCNHCDDCGAELERNERERPIDKLARVNKGDFE